jgi:hypothetical protein
VVGAIWVKSMVTMLLSLVRGVMVTLSLLWMVPLAWMLRRESVLVKPMLVPARGVKVLVSRRATSKASLAVLDVSPATRWLSLMVNWRVLAPVGMMKAWVSSESFCDCSVSVVAVPLMMLVAPAVFQVVGVVKSPLVMPMRAPAVRWAGLTPLANAPAPPLPLPEIALIIAQSIVDGSLRMPGLRLVLRRSLG